MELTVTSTQRDIFGVWQVDITINGKASYHYELYSKYSYDLMMSHYKAGRYGRCLAVLNKDKADFAHV